MCSINYNHGYRFQEGLLVPVWPGFNFLNFAVKIDQPISDFPKGPTKFGRLESFSRKSSIWGPWLNADGEECQRSTLLLVCIQYWTLLMKNHSASFAVVVSFVLYSITLTSALSQQHARPESSRCDCLRARPDRNESNLTYLERLSN